MPGLKVLLGTSTFGDPKTFFGNDENILQAVGLLKKHGIRHLDSAVAYGASEFTIGRLGLGLNHEMIIDTKWIGGYSGQPGATSRDHIREATTASLENLQVKKVDVFYMHSPDYQTPIAETLYGINEAYKSGAFERFGISNYTAVEVQQTFDLSKSKNYVLPTVYQGNYSAVFRYADTELLPLLRKLGISFYAYSPIAGGFLTKTRRQLEEGVGRFAKDQMYGVYHGLFVQDAFLESLSEWDHIAAEEGLGKSELAYRWLSYHSPLKAQLGDGMVIGASSLIQLDETLKALSRGPLNDRAANKIELIWQGIVARGEHE